jgi:hypothetical protein
MIASGLFYSKLSYCLPLVSATWGLDRYRDTITRVTSFTKEDNRRLQVLQNHLCRLLLNTQGNYYRQNQPTQELLEKCEELSSHQLGAQRTLVMLKKIILNKKPSYLADKLQIRPAIGARSASTIAPLDASLGITRSSFMYRGVKLFNQLPEDLRKLGKISLFKNGLKTWIKENISVKP